RGEQLVPRFDPGLRDDVHLTEGVDNLASDVVVVRSHLDHRVLLEVRRGFFNPPRVYLTAVLRRNLGLNLVIDRTLRTLWNLPGGSVCSPNSGKLTNVAVTNRLATLPVDQGYHPVNPCKQ